MYSSNEKGGSVAEKGDYFEISTSNITLKMRPPVGVGGGGWITCLFRFETNGLEPTTKPAQPPPPFNLREGAGNEGNTTKPTTILTDST